MNNKQLCKELQDRGLIFQHSTKTLEELFPENTKRIAYLGIDPTADSIHIGNLITYIFAQHLINAGHDVHFLVGGATGLIGDPSGKLEERTFADEAIIKDRAQKIETQIKNIPGLNYDKTVVNNLDWFKNITLIDFLRDIGKNFTINTMIKKESVKQRIEGDNGLSFTEFSYSLFQAFDFLQLNKTINCDLQIGGADQWGNIISGIDLVRRKEQKEVFGVTIPLIVDKATGRKFGKSEGGAIWLNPEKTSYYDFYQFWLNINDESAIDYLYKFTFLPFEKIKDIKKQMETEPQMRSAQYALAFEVTQFVHGKEIAQEVEQVSKTLFSNGEIWNENAQIHDLLKKHLLISTVDDKTNVVDLLIEKELATSKRQAREFIENNAIRINGEIISSIDAIINHADFTSGNINVLQRGKKKKALFTT